MLVEIIPNPYRTEAAYGEPKAEHSNEVLCDEGRKTADLGKDEAAPNAAIRRLPPKNGD